MTVRLFVHLFFGACCLTIVCGVVFHWMAIRRELRLIRSVGGAQSTEKFLGVVVGLHVEGAAFDGTQLAKLRSLHNLRELQIACTKITEEDLDLLLNLQSLETLWLYDNSMTDSALAHLVTLPRLRVLGLRIPRLTDGGLRRLATFQQLTYLRIDAGTLSDAARSELRVALPNCQIEFELDE